MFLGWYDDTPKKSITEKIEEAIQHYRAKYSEAPTLCLVNDADLTTYQGIEVRAVSYVRPNYFWVGREESPAQTFEAA